MSAEQLSSILAHAETLGLPEGTYLSVSNKLKSAFEEQTNKSNKSNIPPVIMNNTLPHTMEFVGIDDKYYKLTVDYGTFTPPHSSRSDVAYRVHFKITDNDGNCKSLSAGCPRCYANILSFYKPLDITITAEGHSIKWNYEKTMAARMKEHKCYMDLNDDDDDDCGFDHSIKRFHLEVAACFNSSIEYWIDTKGTPVQT